MQIEQRNMAKRKSVKYVHLNHLTDAGIYRPAYQKSSTQHSYPAGLLMIPNN